MSTIVWMVSFLGALIVFAALVYRVAELARRIDELESQAAVCTMRHSTLVAETKQAFAAWAGSGGEPEVTDEEPLDWPPSWPPKGSGGPW
ncbi:MAG TPA: hypothetical protein VF062_22275 [Candidatus Limnocylindrales bacterium]